MAVPVLLLIFLIVLGVFSRRFFTTANRALFLVILICVFVLISGLRGRYVGSDTHVYIDLFNTTAEMELDQFTNYMEAKAWKDPLYFVTSWAFGQLIPSPQLWLALVSLVFLLGVAFVCYWESPDYAFSMLYVLAMGLYFFSLTGLRQSMAMGITFMSYYFVVKRRLLPFLILLLIATLIHKSALIFIIIYPMAYTRTGWARLLMALLFFMIVLIFKNTIGNLIIEYIPDFISDGRLEDYLGSTASFTAAGFIIQLIMFIFCLRYRKPVVEEVPHREVLYNMLFLGLIFQAAAMSIAEFFRIAMYFNAFNMVLIPICMQYESDSRNYSFVRFVVILAFVAYFFYSTIKCYDVVPYHTFWQAL